MEKPPCDSTAPQSGVMAEHYDFIAGLEVSDGRACFHDFANRFVPEYQIRPLVERSFPYSMHAGCKWSYGNRSHDGV
jgi:hypothetical protein